MAPHTISNWFQVLASIAVLVGIYFVVVELAQQRELSDMDAYRSTFASMEEGHSWIVGENASEVVAKACFQPDELTDAERVQMHHLFMSVMLRHVGIANVRIIDDSQWKISAIAELRWILSFELGGLWMRNVSGEILKSISTADHRVDYRETQDLVELIEEALDGGRTYSCQDIYRGNFLQPLAANN